MLQPTVNCQLSTVNSLISYLLSQLSSSGSCRTANEGLLFRKLLKDRYFLAQSKIIHYLCTVNQRRGCLHINWRRVADILKRRLLTLCSDVVKSRKFQKYSGLSNDRCSTGYRLSLLCLFGTLFAYSYARTRVP